MSIEYKFNEPKLLKEIADYVTGTYGEHYGGKYAPRNKKKYAININDQSDNYFWKLSPGP